MRNGWLRLGYLAFVIIPNLGKALLAKDGISIEIVFELQEVVGRVFQEKSQVFERGFREPTMRFPKKV